MHDQPLVSVIIRTQNRRELLRQALESVAQQDYPRVEVVVVNDGGTDVTKAIGAVPGRASVRLIDLQPGRGRSAAANAGIAAARGHWVSFLDDDDLLTPPGLTWLVEAANTEKVVPYGRVDAYLHREGEAPRLFQIFNRPFDPHALLFENFIPINACLIPAGILRAVGGMDERLECFEDWDLFLRLSDRLPFRHVDRQVAEYRIFDQAFITGRGGQERQHRGRVAIFAKHAQRYTPEALSRMQYVVKTTPSVSERAAAELEAKLRERETQLAAAGARLVDLTGRLDEAERAVRAIESSRGWRLFQGVRKLLGRR